MYDTEVLSCSGRGMAENLVLTVLSALGHPALEQDVPVRAWTGFLLALAPRLPPQFVLSSAQLLSIGVLLGLVRLCSALF